MTNSTHKENLETAIRREIALGMMTRLDLMKIKPKMILSSCTLCKTLLQARFTEAKIISEVEDHSTKVDLIFSNLDLAYSKDLKQKLFSWHDRLNRTGVLMFTTLGPDTLKELPSQPFDLIDVHNLGDELTQLGFKDPVLDVDRVSINYQNQNNLIKDLLETDWILPKIKFKENNDTCNLTFEIIYSHAFYDGKLSSTKEINIPIEKIGRIRNVHHEN